MCRGSLLLPQADRPFQVHGARSGAMFFWLWRSFWLWLWILALAQAPALALALAFGL
ncbi:hypothetical protein LUTEI9C_30251 [Luteimonas sp. 9C]|nr:hypothetical protein LUTEI9C_30251 [Luteimonas sp. 9C]